ncbi:MAG: DUF1786 domain-containing protein [Anaerolineaceae bacterium]|nr:MAG: DUF1786 domain-containing protein [Anaerolineaceae bacterium]
MKILCVDVGTGTQDILLFDTILHPENSFKLVVPSPTMMIRRRLQAATRQGNPVLLTGVTMGGGPSHWAAEDHLKQGLPLYATPAAARSFNDDLDYLQQQGIQVVSEDEARHLPHETVRLESRDFDFGAIQRALAEFGVSVDDLAAVAVAVFDHGNAPPKISDRKFRFDYIAERVQADSRLSTFAFSASDIPPIMTRMKAVAASAQEVDAPLLLMDTAPAAVAGALLDPQLSTYSRLLVANIGNLHTLTFRIGMNGIEGTFEHHTGLLDQPKLEGLLRALADGSLRNEDVFNDHGHGALIVEPQPYIFPADSFGVVVTGPRRSMMQGSPLRPYFATPYGDMMLAGCFGLLTAVADKLPQFSEPIWSSLRKNQGRPPWEIEE